MIYGYARVSTKSQINNNSFEEQSGEILSKYPTAEIKLEQYSGKTTDRPILNALICDLQGGDVVVVTKLDRLARSTTEGIKLIQDLFIKGVSVHILNIGLLEDTPCGKFFITTLLAVAELERTQIVERTQRGKEIARTKDGFKEGRPRKYNDDYLKNAVKLLESHSYAKVSKMTGMSKSTLQRAKRELKGSSEEDSEHYKE